MIGFLFAIEELATDLLANQAVKTALNAASVAAPPSVRITIAAVRLVIHISRR